MLIWNNITWYDTNIWCYLTDDGILPLRSQWFQHPCWLPQPCWAKTIVLILTNIIFNFHKHHHPPSASSKSSSPLDHHRYNSQLRVILRPVVGGDRFTISPAIVPIHKRKICLCNDRDDENRDNVNDVGNNHWWWKCIVHTQWVFSYLVRFNLDNLHRWMLLSAMYLFRPF